MVGPLASNRQNQLNRHNFGGAFSGPVFKDRTFFFLSYEGLRQKQAILLTSNVPTMAQRASFATSPAGAAYAQIVNLLPIGIESTTNGVTTAVATGSSPGPVKTDQVQRGFVSQCHETGYAASLLRMAAGCADGAESAVQHDCRFWRSSERASADWGRSTRSMCSRLRW